MAKERILIVEDDKNISKLVRYNLEKEGFECLLSITGEDALEVLGREEVDLILLDIMLPKMDGLETCKRIKQEKCTQSIPVIMLTAKGEEIDRILGFELGADDYVVKPFSPRELLLRIKAVLKRHKPAIEEKEVFSIGNITLDIPRHKVTIGNKNIKLTSMEFKLLKTLIGRKGRVQTRESLLNEVWGISSEVTTRTVDTHVKLLRQKMGRAGKIIETVRGFGYKVNDD